MPKTISLFTAVLLLAGSALAAEHRPAPLSPNCQAKLALTEEVTRLLTKAASHATSSSACIDGPGERVVVDQVLVCPASEDKNAVKVDASFQVTRWAEGDTRMCGQMRLPKGPEELAKPEEMDSGETQPDLCSGTPGISHHRMRFSFARQGKSLVIQVPVQIAGLENMTPLNEVHKGGCYGQSGPFVPARIRL